MKISWQWIEEFFPHPQSCTAQVGAQILTAQGLEVEGLDSWGDLDPLIVVARVVEKRPHPGADRLSLCRVSTGHAVFSVVCGAANVAQGGLYPFAQIGARLPGGMVIKPARLRGELSEGMLCSETELGLPLVEEGLLTLPPESVEGTAVRDIFGIGDTVLEINVTPNRGDCLSHLGIARELYAHFEDWDLAYLNRVTDARIASSDWQPIALEVAVPSVCPMYVGRAVRGLVARPSPFWVRRRLAACGIRPINAIVDASNYVLLERGHPTHAFDLSALDGARLSVGVAESAHDFEALDGNRYGIVPGDGVIARIRGDGTQSEPIAVAGIIGGANSKVTPETTAVFLECAVFDPVAVRRSAKHITVTDSSYRFERGVDRDDAEPVMARLTALLQAWAAGPAFEAGTVVRVVAPAVARPRIAVSLDRLDRFLGLSIPQVQIEHLLRRLGFAVTARESTRMLEVMPPSYRADVEGWADSAEEVARILGYDRIPSRVPWVQPRVHPLSRLDQLRRTLVSAVTAQGYAQTIHMSFVSALAGRGFNPDTAVAIANPLSEHDAFLRQTLSHQLLQTYLDNQHRGVRQARLLEVGNVFETVPGDAPYRQSLHLALLLAGSDSPATSPDFLTLKGVLDGVFQAAKVGDVDAIEWRRPTTGMWSDILHPGRSAVICHGQTVIGYAGELHPLYVAQKKMTEAPLLAEISLEALLPLLQSAPQYRPVSAFPGTSRDVTVVVPEAMTFGDLADFFDQARAHSPILESVEFVSLYRGPSLPTGSKSLSFRFNFGSLERTLTDEEVNAIYFSLIERVKLEKQVDIRS